MTGNCVALHLNSHGYGLFMIEQNVWLFSLIIWVRINAFVYAVAKRCSFWFKMNGVLRFQNSLLGSQTSNQTDL